MGRWMWGLSIPGRPIGDHVWIILHPTLIVQFTILPKRIEHPRGLARFRQPLSKHREVQIRVVVVEVRLIAEVGTRISVSELSEGPAWL